MPAAQTRVAAIMERRTALFRLWGAYYVVTGLWPLIHLASFERVTGPKTDDWLVHMVGLLAAVIGGTLLRASARPTTETATLAVASALAFAAIDVWYAATGVISSIYIADAVVELLLIAAFFVTGRRDVR